jgi:hypothetical protein
VLRAVQRECAARRSDARHGAGFALIHAVRLTAAVLVVATGFGALRYATTQEHEPTVDRTTAAWTRRVDTLERARVFVNEPSSHSVLDANPGDPRPFFPDERMTCDYVPKRASGTTPKFDCRLRDGTVVRVKYGRTPEIHAEIAATRFLAALGFGADHVSLVHTLQCVGCPIAPFRTRQLAQLFWATGALEYLRNRSHVRSFTDVSVERKLEAAAIEVGGFEGWQWAELKTVRQDRGGASPADLDALRLVAVLLGHWDNKASNQRLACLDFSTADAAAGDMSRPCQHPLLMLQDLGSTFGPRKLDYNGWAQTPVWKDAARCTVTMRDLPYRGATFVDATLSEGGRLELARRLRALPDSQLEALFTGAAFPAVAGDREGEVGPWARAMRAKIREVVDRPPCPR